MLIYKAAGLEDYVWRRICPEFTRSLMLFSSHMLIFLGLHELQVGAKADVDFSVLFSGYYIY